jgi:antimicrobial peptide system SdpA family protein
MWVSGLVYFTIGVVTLTMSLPSNVLIQRNSTSLLRNQVTTIYGQQFAYFTKDPKSLAVTPYTVADLSSLNRLPQNRTENAFGISRKQRAQGPEVAIITNQMSQEPVDLWVSCSGPKPIDCLRDFKMQDEARSIPTQREKITNKSPLHTVCGDVYLLMTVGVPFEYRNLVDYTQRATKVSKVNVSCE